MRCQTPRAHGPTNQASHQPGLAAPVAAHVRHSLCLVTLGSNEGAFSALLTCRFLGCWLTVSIISDVISVFLP